MGAKLRMRQIFWTALLMMCLYSVAGATTRPHYGGTLRVEMRERVGSLDPREWPSDQAEALGTERLAALVFEELVSLDQSAGPQPALAVSWEHDAEQKRWEFHLRPKVKFHDGTPLTPSAVAISLQASLGGERAVSVTGESLVIQAPRPTPDLPAELAQGHNFIFRVTPDGNTVGTGPFRVAEWQPWRRAVLAANEDSWMGRPFLDSIIVEMGISRPQQLIDLELGKADLVQLAADQVRRAPANGGRVWLSAPLELLAVVFDAQRAAVQDARMRQAIALSIDRASILNVLLQKQGEMTAGLLPQWLSGYAFLFPTAPDVERAKRLRGELSSAGPVSLVYDPADAVAQSIAERLAVNAREVGITVRVFAQSSGPAAKSSADARLVRVRVGSTNPRAALASVIAASGQPDALPPAGASPEQLYAAELGMVETYRVVPLLHVPEIYGLSARVKNWMPRHWGAWRLDNIWVQGTAAVSGNKP